VPPLSSRVGSSVSSSAARGRWLARGAWLLAVAEGLAAVRSHLKDRLTDKERARLVEIVKTSKGRPSNLSDRERRELQALIVKAEPRALAKTVASSSLASRMRRR
jgi:hypothetical protein